ncbi:MAG: hypothetical protein ABJA66_03215 [Actinomycetota bacterium]
MSKKNLLVLSILLALFQIAFAGEIKAQTSNPHDFGERFVVGSVRLIHSAEATFQATTGAGLYGTLAELQQVTFIDSILASGEKYGYHFVLSKTNPTATMAARFYLTATPRNYPKSGRRSFYIDESGEMRGDDKTGGVANANDPIIDDCASFGFFANERCVIFDLRTFHGAETTYQATAGYGNYGSFSQLLATGLINSRTASGTNHGYTFTLQTVDQIPGVPAFFSLKATPINYGVTGTRSFYINVSGVILGADKQGQPADENDPPIE